MGGWDARSTGVLSVLEEERYKERKREREGGSWLKRTLLYVVVGFCKPQISHHTRIPQTRIFGSNVESH